MMTIIADTPIRYVRKLLNMSILTCLLGEEKLLYSEQVSHIKYDKWLVRLIHPFWDVESKLVQTKVSC